MTYAFLTGLDGDGHAGLQGLRARQLRSVMNIHTQVMSYVMGTVMSCSLDRRQRKRQKQKDKELIKRRQTCMAQVREERKESEEKQRDKGESHMRTQRDTDCVIRMDAT